MGKKSWMSQKDFVNRGKRGLLQKSIIFSPGNSSKLSVTREYQVKDFKTCASP
jgi:hypothetical protein